MTESRAWHDQIEGVAPFAPGPRRPVLRYHGGKWRLAPWILSWLPPHRLYVEPFGGGGSVLLRKPRSQSHAEVYNDLDGEIVNVFRVLRDPELAGRLRSMAYLTPWSREDWLASHQPSADPVEQACRTIARGYMSHGSMSRLEKRSGFRARNLRSGTSAAVDWSEWPDQVPAFVERLRGVTIENRPALEVIEQQDSVDTLFYADPPYPLSARSAQRWPSDLGKGYSNELTDSDHAALAAKLHDVVGMVVLSGYHCPLTDALYSDWTCRERETIADGAKRRVEVVWFNPAAERAHRQLSIEVGAEQPKGNSLHPVAANVVCA